MIKKFKNDAIAGFSVFLLALPLCLGIAVASDFPPIAGILSAITGGIIASFCGGARLAIKGPAAGLILITLGSVHQLGGGDLVLGYKRTLAVGVIAALIQILLSVAKKGILAEVIPSSIIHGMMAAIGVSIVAKQAYLLMGLIPSCSKPVDLLINLPMEIDHLNPIIFGLGLLSFAIIIGFPLIKHIKHIEPSMVILLLVVPLSLYFHLNIDQSYYFMGHAYALKPSFFINLPNNFFYAFCFPDFSIIFSAISLKYILMFALIGSIESLLTICAIDLIVPKLAPSDLNKDLRAVGVGNLVSSLIGGLPMISEIIRSKANIDYGAKSVWANFFHGSFMLIAVILLPNTLNLIPLSALAALLICVGIRLTSPAEFIHNYRIGRDHFTAFIVTFFVTLFTDLLTGVMAGIFLKLIIYMVRGNNLKKLFTPTITMKKLKNSVDIIVTGPLTFFGYLRLKKMIEIAAHNTKKIVIDLHAVTYLDHTVLRKFSALSHELKDINLIIKENPALLPFYDHPLSAKGLPKNKNPL